MKTKYKILMTGLIMALVSIGMLWAQEHPREGEVQGSFLRLAEQERIEAEPHPGPQEHKQPFGREFERQQVVQRIEQAHTRLAELKEAAEQAEREGQPEKAAEMREKAKKLAGEIEAFAQKTKGRMPAEAQERIERLRDMAAEAEKRGEVDKARDLWAEVKELEGAMKREFERGPEPPEDVRERLEVERRWPRPMEIEPWRERIRERPEPPGPWANLERMQKELHDVLAEHLERMANEFRELQMRVERMERELQQLRAENMRLKSQWRERPRPRKGPEREVREPGEVREREETQR